MILSGWKLTHHKAQQDYCWTDMRDEPTTIDTDEVADWAYYRTHCVKGFRLAAIMQDGTRVAVYRNGTDAGSEQRAFVDSILRAMKYPAGLGRYASQTWSFLSKSPAFWTDKNLYGYGAETLGKIEKSGRTWRVVSIANGVVYEAKTKVACYTFLKETVK